MFESTSNVIRKVWEEVEEQLNCKNIFNSRFVASSKLKIVKFGIDSLEANHSHYRFDLDSGSLQSKLIDSDLKTASKHQKFGIQ